MRFNLIDRIVAVEPGRSLQALKNLTLGEEYLADHFPGFPVMPGVLMLQTLVEAGAWLLRLTDDYRHSVVALREARNVKYGTFMEPGRQMRVSVELVERSGDLAVFKGKGEADGQQTVAARLTLCGYNLRDRNPALQAADERLVRHWRDLGALLALSPPGERQLKDQP
jgi:3-hydroxyacyl-[acyl-carrier-protein] dehydratase